MRAQERFQRDQHDIQLIRKRTQLSDSPNAATKGHNSHMVRLVRLSSTVSRRDIRRFFKDFDIDDNSIRYVLMHLLLHGRHTSTRLLYAIIVGRAPPTLHMCRLSTAAKE